ncbi:hypothetical protein SUGI_0973610 [Cryptomeria japonica]|nr:hypothetical protein SUGI_0973610 [Cryptomeria japonica]
MASSIPKMGTSFKVDDVQELVKMKRENVPERYIRPQQERIGCTALRNFSGVESWNRPGSTGANKGYGHAFIKSDGQKLDWCNMMALGTMPKSTRKENLWPAKPLQFSDTVEAYSTEVSTLCWKLLSIIAETLGLNSNIFKEIFGENVQAVWMNFYPPCPRPDLVLGLSAHSDGSALTVLLQDDECVGLQILNQNQWISVEPIPDALVINIGDTLEVLTNGRYKSVEHRAVTNINKERLSIVTFHAPSYDVDLGPLPQMIDEDHPRLFRNYKHADYNRHYLSNELNGKKSLEFVRM